MMNFLLTVMIQTATFLEEGGRLQVTENLIKIKYAIFKMCPLYRLGEYS